jgi:hypothetical protein
MGIVPGGEALLGRALALGFILDVGRCSAFNVAPHVDDVGNRTKPQKATQRHE